MAILGGICKAKAGFVRKDVFTYAVEADCHAKGNWRVNGRHCTDRVRGTDGSRLAVISFSVPSAIAIPTGVRRALAVPFVGRAVAIVAVAAAAAALAAARVPAARPRVTTGPRSATTGPRSATTGPRPAARDGSPEAGRFAATWYRAGRRAGQVR